MASGDGDRPQHFRDQRVTAWDFVADEVLVRCPRCDACARVVRRPGVESSSAGQSECRRVVCTGCGFVLDEPPGVRVLRSPERSGVVHDPFFRYPLWLQADCCGHVLWAYNRQHLEYLRSFVSARVRERPAEVPESESARRMTLVAKLPAWLKAAKNRDQVLHAIDRLRASG